MSFSASEPFKATKIWNNLVEHLKTNLEPKKRRCKLQVFDNCFKGSEVLEELQNYVFSHPELTSDPSKVQVKSLGQMLVDSRIIECVVSTETKNFDHGNRLYRFVESSNSLVNISNTSCEQKTEKKKKRLSLDRWNVHRKSSKNKSVAISLKDEIVLPWESFESNNNENELRRKRRMSFGGSSESKGTDCPSSLVGTPRKSRRRSFVHNRKSRHLSQLEEANICKDVWFEVTLSSLLKLVDITFLEDILIPAEAICLKGRDIPNNPYNRLLESLDLSYKQKTGRRGRDCIWKEAAAACFNALREYPLLQNGEFGFHTNVAITEAGISNSLAKFYGSLSDTLIPGKFAVLLDGIHQLLKTRNQTALQALRLLLFLVPHDRQEHLKRLLNFFDKSLLSQARISREHRKHYICRIFKNSILPSGCQDKEVCEDLLSFMISEHKKLFYAPPAIKSEVKRHLSCMQSSYQEPTLSISACRRITMQQYDHQKDTFTTQCLTKLINSVMDDLTLSIKIKESKLKEFQMEHPDVFHLHFPDGQI